jgi:hypothetical protein
MFEQAKRYVHAVLWERGATLRELMTANATYVDAHLAAFYDDVPATWHMTPFVADADQRSGILTQPGVLAMLATPFTESIIYRGIYVHRKFLCTAELGRPPFTAIRATATFTTGFNEAMHAHFRAHHVYCADCHEKIDPPGFALHHYDAIGRWRDVDDLQLPIEDDVVLPIDGAKIRLRGSGELGRVLAESEQVAHCVVDQLAHHALGRAVLDPAMRAYLYRAFEQSDRSLVEVFRTIATSPIFRARGGQ